ncbi:hypothetical protein CF168_01760 [Shewanella bicestrii]|uniref:site-specific DNA-methyltransferase (adenine-specific) n=1 Tax=Shewanella bicestrii TaxID=2018305 RepID=A0A220UIE3_9GAMM|nr:N-6 DNA methylase [Shewanella bicestrii]ASK67682.1 hypothetical protein CF168_01760 [Shewanella bicestrii]
MSKKISLQQLETVLWKGITEHRGNLDYSVIRDQVLCLMFIKYLSDRFLLEREQITQTFLQQGHSLDKSEVLAEEPNAYQTGFIPLSTSWASLVNINPFFHLGNELNRVAESIERYQPWLSGVLTSVDFCQSFNHADEKAINRFWAGLIHFFSSLDLASDYSDDFPQLFSGLLKRFADAEGKKGGVFYTPKEVVSLMVHLIKPNAKMSVYDPTCGFGGALIQADEYLRKNSTPRLADHLLLFGQELSYSTAAVCRMNLIANGLFYARIECGDTLISPKYVRENRLERFDRVLCHPPFSLKLTNPEEYYFDNFGQFSFGFPPKSSADLAFLQHVIASLNDTGLGAVVMPLGALFRGNSEQAIREEILRCDLVESVIALPPGIFYGTSISTCLVIVNKSKHPDRKGKVLFVDASQEFEAGQYMNMLTGDGSQRVVEAFEKFESLGAFSKVIPVDELLRNDAKLDVKRYIDNSPVIREIATLLRHHEGFEQVSLSNKKMVNAIEVVKADTNLDTPNAIYLRRTRPEHAAISLGFSMTPKPNEYLRLTFNQDRLLSEYAKLFFESQLGKLMLGQIPTGVSIQRLQAKSIQALSIPIPKLEVQQEVIKVAGKLEIARKQIDLFFSKLTTEPKQYKAIEDNTDAMVYTLSSMSDTKYLQHLISFGETRQMEFKQSFFANADKLHKPEGRIEKDSGVQAEVIKDIVSFINTSGGILLIGVNDKGKVLGVDLECKRFKFNKMDNYFQELGAQLASRISPDYLQYCKLTEVPFEDKTVVRIDCSPSSHPIFMDNTKFYVRTDTSSPELTGNSMLRYIQNHFKVALFNDPETHSPTA